MENPILAEMRRFSEAYGRERADGALRWRYYRLGVGPAVVWLTGGLRRAAFGFASLELLARRHTVLAPDYPPLKDFEQFDRGLSGILAAEGIGRFHLAGQSYGGILAQPFLARHPGAVDRLVLTSSGPADYGRAWLPVEHLAILLARLLPERSVKRLLARGLGRVLSTAPEQRADWLEALQVTFEHDLTRADVVSHFAVAADLIRKRIVRPEAFRDWRGRAVVLSAENDPTQSRKDGPRYERLFGRPVEVRSLGQIGHTAALPDPRQYAAWLEQALS